MEVYRQVVCRVELFAKLSKPFYLELWVHLFANTEPTLCSLYILQEVNDSQTGSK